MADITYDDKATERRASPGTTPGKGDAFSAKVLIASTVEVGAGSLNETFKFGRIPSNARILAASRVYNDDLASTGSPTMDIGLASVDSNITSDADALTAGIDLAAAGSDLQLIAFADSGLPAWDFVNGQATDPGGELDVYGTVLDASTNSVGTVTVEVIGFLD